MRNDYVTASRQQPGGTGSEPGLFTTAYFHDTAGIASEITDSGLRLHDLLHP